jgi:predicted NAD-dependent protein-ADP-ribosyltransferase YbiA (DUF1768 family)
MSILGKVLALLNVVAAIAFVCVAGLDYGKRQAWTFAVQQQDFILNGLPVDDKEKDVEGRTLVDLIGNDMQKRLFTGLQQPVKTQVKEVEQRQKAVRAEIDGQPDAAAKKTALENALLPLARTWGQRDEWRRKIRDPKADVDALLAPDGLFETAFRQAVQGKTGTEEEKELGPDERRHAIAHVLCNLSAKPDDQRRALAVVGLKAYTAEVDSQATALANMVPEIQRALDEDLVAFEREHGDLIRQIVALAGRVRELQTTLQEQTLLKQEHATLVAARQADVQNVRAEIAQATKATEIALQAQNRLEQALFQTREAIKAAADKNQHLLRQITTAELGR